MSLDKNMIYECAAFRNDLIPHCIVRLNNLVAQLGTKGGLISKGIFSFWSHPQEKMPNHYPQLFNLNSAYVKNLRIVT